ncbi:Ppx/GppA phosphatase family protein [Pedobacter duraquae]|uniref:Exopolyphosphatase/guanosine-5'-triphosphate, 3'-diphosphate pyrophosphatase n=1 Tax=Pedobacter duraquae TaxID=425511 RepID=A0A4R6IM03_9SPHI|nr:exopolyphosphatase [Pedobacter duraquae]TDO23006.1 exopolyphosphatase/guanosine-5'-triphosphate,3'-diphosphate pyrophosphatase [Pedobacter duraquae]
MIAAAIDLGTNTFHLIIAKSDGGERGEPEILFKTNLPVRLGEARINQQEIIPAAFERGLLALEGFAEEIKKHNVDAVKAVATAAVRSAANGQAFVDAAKDRAGITIEIISGEEEAAYIFKGVEATGLVTDCSLIMDIGGGSTEFIICKPGEVLWKHSYNIGAARLMQGFFKSDPLSAEEKEAIIKHLDTELPELFKQCAKWQPQLLIGSAGAFESYAAMLNPGNHNASIAITPFRTLADKLFKSTHDERTKMEGLIPLRVDMIVMAALLTNYVLDHAGIPELKLSTYDLKIGVLYSLLKCS